MRADMRRKNYLVGSQWLQTELDGGVVAGGRADRRAGENREVNISPKIMDVDCVDHSGDHDPMILGRQKKKEICMESGQKKKVICMESGQKKKVICMESLASDEESNDDEDLVVLLESKRRRTRMGVVHGDVALHAADVLLWRNKKISASFLGSVTAAWIFFELLELIPSTYSCLSHFDCCTWSLVLVVKGTYLYQQESTSHPTSTDSGRSNSSVLRDIASGKDLKKFLMNSTCEEIAHIKGWFDGEKHIIATTVPLAKPLDNIGLKIDTPPATSEKDKLIVLI
ncbi:hypothetical protein F8388_018907 [Cannabis sativa]|uniref:Reticulon-like protein n=1 Tax=Cannabis sativa TaxID=3483 RepID=A0A7J6FZX0_CANSA|nr:hypothetical protein F8388_018907 [Cannabis sativa]